MNKIIILGIGLILFSCKAGKKTVKNQLLNNETFLISEISTDSTYGLSSTNPVEVGGAIKVRDR